jgi:hypothetical protein
VIRNIRLPDTRYLISRCNIPANALHRDLGIHTVDELETEGVFAVSHFEGQVCPSIPSSRMVRRAQWS